jgi:hypothetical protein
MHGLVDLSSVANSLGQVLEDNGHRLMLKIVAPHGQVKGLVLTANYWQRIVEHLDQPEGMALIRRMEVKELGTQWQK